MVLLYILIGLLIGAVVGGLYFKTLATKDLSPLKAQLDLLQSSEQDIREQLEQTRSKNLELVQENANLTTHNEHLQKRIEEGKKELVHTQERLTSQFQNLANELLEQKSKKFTEQNKSNIESLLKPLGEKLNAFEKQVEQSNKDSLARNVALQTEIKKLNELNTQITKDAENLTKAIKGDNRVQGQWGEFILESILEKSGLVKDREYSIQTSFATEEGKRYRPDVIVKLPDNKNVIIDAKISLVSYEKFANATSEEERVIHGKKHLQSVRNHLKELSGKNYSKEYNLSGLDFVLMFIPIEPAFSLAIQQDLHLFNEAYEKNIVIVSPTTLIATLRTIANLWKNEYQNQHVMQIAQQGGALYDKFVGFVEDLKKVGRQLETCRNTYVSTAKKLYEGRDNLVSKAQKIKELGANTTKSLDNTLIEKAESTRNTVA